MLNGASSAAAAHSVGTRPATVRATTFAAVSAEVRYPLTSPLRVERFGVKAFVDAGTVWSAGGRLNDQRFERGLGGGVYLGAAAIIMDLDVAWPEKGTPRAHFGLGVSF